MTNSYIKGNEYQNKFKNRMEREIINDEEYQRFKEEETNTKKMSTILKSLNQPFRRNHRITGIGKAGSQAIHGNKGGANASTRTSHNIPAGASTNLSSGN